MKLWMWSTHTMSITWHRWLLMRFFLFHKHFYFKIIWIGGTCPWLTSPIQSSFHRNHWFYIYASLSVSVTPNFFLPQIIVFYTFLYSLLNIYFGCYLTYLYNFFSIKVCYKNKVTILNLLHVNVNNIFSKTDKHKNSEKSGTVSQFWKSFQCWLVRNPFIYAPICFCIVSLYIVLVEVCQENTWGAL